MAPTSRPCDEPGAEQHGRRRAGEQRGARSSRRPRAAAPGAGPGAARRRGRSARPRTGSAPAPARRSGGRARSRRGCTQPEPVPADRHPHQEEQQQPREPQALGDERPEQGAGEEQAGDEDQAAVVQAPWAGSGSSPSRTSLGARAQQQRRRAQGRRIRDQRNGPSRAPIDRASSRGLRRAPPCAVVGRWSVPRAAGGSPAEPAGVATAGGGSAAATCLRSSSCSRAAARVTAAPGSTLGRRSVVDRAAVGSERVARARARDREPPTLPRSPTPDRPRAPGSTGSRWAAGRSSCSDGAVLRLGDAEVAVERPRDDRDSGRTSVVPAHATAMTAAAVGGSDKPRLRPGYALKRLEAREGPQRWVLQDLASGPRCGSTRRTSAWCDCSMASARWPRCCSRPRSASGPRGRRAWPRCSPSSPTAGSWRAWSSPGRRRRAAGAGCSRPAASCGRGRLTRSTRCTAAAAWRLATDPGLVAMAAIALAGLVAFVVLLAGGQARPLVVADRVGLGGFVFLVGRALVAAAARDGARARAGGLRPARPRGRAEAAARVPLRLRGHLGGVARAAAAAHRRERRRAGVRPRRSAARSPSPRSPASRASCATCSTS